MAPANTKKVHSKLGENILGMFLWKVFFTFSECLCSSFDHTLTPRNLYKPFDLLLHYFAYHPQFTQTILNFIYISGCFMFCVKQCCTCKVNYIYLVKNLPRIFSESWNCPNLVGTFSKRSAIVMCKLGHTLRKLVSHLFRYKK